MYMTSCLLVLETGWALLLIHYQYLTRESLLGCVDTIIYCSNFYLSLHRFICRCSSVDNLVGDATLDIGGDFSVSFPKLVTIRIRDSKPVSVIHMYEDGGPFCHLGLSLRFRPEWRPFQPNSRVHSEKGKDINYLSHQY